MSSSACSLTHCTLKTSFGKIPLEWSSIESNGLLYSNASSQAPSESSRYPLKEETMSHNSWRIPKLFRPISEKPRLDTLYDSKIRQQLVSEKLWPSTLDHESYKASLILGGFCRDGMLKDALPDKQSGSLPPQPKLFRIPPEIISKARGLIICSILRAGLWQNGAGGSGVAVVRLEDGSWSCPAAIEVQTAEIGVIVGVDIYDCVLVLNNAKSVEAIKKGRFFVGADLYAVSGPLNISWFMESDNRSKSAPVFSYLRSQGYHAEVTLDNTTIVTERLQENEEFYSPQKIAASDILSGKVNSPPYSINGFHACLKSAQGDLDFEHKLIPVAPAPSDFKVVEEGHAFGIPDIEDPDPYGVMALEKEGLLLRDAQTKRTADPEVFEFNPSLNSPLHSRYHRRMGDSSSISGRSSWRQSTLTSGDKFDDGASSLSVRTGPDSRRVSVSSAVASPASTRPVQVLDDETTAKHEPNDLNHNSKQEHSEEGINHGGTENGRISRQSLVSQSPTILEELQAVLEKEKVDFTPEELLFRKPGNQAGHSKEHSLSEKIAGSSLQLSAGIDQSVSPMADGAHKVNLEPGKAGTSNGHFAADKASETVEDISNPVVGPQPRGWDSSNFESQEVESDVGTDSDQSDDHDEDFEVFDGNQGRTSTVTYGGATTFSVSRPKVVDVLKPLPPPSLPARHPARIVSRLNVESDAASARENTNWDVTENPTSASMPEDFAHSSYDHTVTEGESPSEKGGNTLKAVSPSSSTEDIQARLQPQRGNTRTTVGPSLADIREGLKRSPSASPER